MSAGSPAETSLLERIGKAPLFPTKPPDVVLFKAGRLQTWPISNVSDITCGNLLDYTQLRKGLRYAHSNTAQQFERDCV